MNQSCSSLSSVNSSSSYGSSFTQHSTSSNPAKANGVVPALQKKIGNKETVHLIIAVASWLKRLMAQSSPDSSNISSNVVINGFSSSHQNEDEMEIESSSSSSSQGHNIFTGKKMPKISIEDYLGRLIYFINKDYQQEDCRFESVGSRTLIIATIILERFLILNRSIFTLEARTVHRTFFAAYLIALKMNEDEQLAGDLHARAGGLPKMEMNLLVLEFCKMSNYNFIVQQEVCVQQFKSLMGIL